jgi:hypothetical protein
MRFGTATLIEGGSYHVRTPSGAEYTLRRGRSLDVEDRELWMALSVNSRFRCRPPDAPPEALPVTARPPFVRRPAPAVTPAPTVAPAPSTTAPAEEPAPTPALTAFIEPSPEVLLAADIAPESPDAAIPGVDDAPPPEDTFGLPDESAPAAVTTTEPPADPAPAETDPAPVRPSNKKHSGRKPRK